MEKNLFSGLSQVALSKSSWIAIAPTIDPIDPPLTHLFKQVPSLKGEKGDWWKALGREVRVGSFLCVQWFLASCSNYAVRFRGMVFLGQSRCRNNILRLNIFEQTRAVEHPALCKPLCTIAPLARQLWNAFRFGLVEN